MNSINKKGSITPALLIITGAFLVVIYGLLMLLSMQLDYSHRRVASEEALNIAEAGVNYYRWHLAHAPNDFTDNTGEAGPYVHVYKDPQGREVGEYSLEITPQVGSSIVTIRSTGKSYANPGITRAITVQYGKPSFAKYAFLNNASSWYGDNITVHGDIHSNNGIRMDGTNTGRVTSYKDEYMCGSETGCSPPRRRPGVWGSGGDQSLWEFPVTLIDFDTVAFDFSVMREAAISEGLHLPDSNRYGYHLVFNTNGTVTVSRVTRVDDYYGYSPPGEGLGAAGQGGCRRRDQLIDRETTIGTYDLNDTPIIFAEDDLWLEGTVNGRVTVVAAGFPVASRTQNIWIKNSLVYEGQDDVLGVIAQNDIYFVRDLPDDFRIDGALLSQKGRIIRHGYFWWCGGWGSDAVKDSLTIYGALISKENSYWNYEGEPPESGFITRTITYDGRLLYAPPPYFPTTGEYEFISWKEE